MFVLWVRDLEMAPKDKDSKSQKQLDDLSYSPINEWNLLSLVMKMLKIMNRFLGQSKRP